MNQKYILEVKVKNTPLLKKKCNRCQNLRFYCSNKFRVNAQKKIIDIWLIYKCTNCDCTYNATILTRTNPEAIKSDLYNKFSENDENMAWNYAFSMETARRNGNAYDFASVEYELLYKGISLVELMRSQEKSVCVEIVYAFNSNLKISSILKELLGVSTGQLGKLIEDKVFSVDSKHLEKKDKAKNGLIVEIDVNRLKTIVSKPVD